MVSEKLSILKVSNNLEIIRLICTFASNESSPTL